MLLGKRIPVTRLVFFAAVLLGAGTVLAGGKAEPIHNAASSYFEQYHINSEKGEFDSRLGLPDRDRIWRLWKRIKPEFVARRGEEGRYCYATASLEGVVLSSLLPGTYLFLVVPGALRQDYDEHPPGFVFPDDAFPTYCSHWSATLNTPYIVLWDDRARVYVGDMYLSLKEFTQFVMSQRIAVSSGEQAFALCRYAEMVTGEGRIYDNWKGLENLFFSSPEDREGCLYSEVKSRFVPPRVVDQGGCWTIEYIEARYRPVGFSKVVFRVDQLGQMSVDRNAISCIDETE